MVSFVLCQFIPLWLYGDDIQAGGFRKSRHAVIHCVLGAAVLPEVSLRLK